MQKGDTSSVALRVGRKRSQTLSARKTGEPWAYALGFFRFGGCRQKRTTDFTDGTDKDSSSVFFVKSVVVFLRWKSSRDSSI
jgi:hypothetical protein